MNLPRLYAALAPLALVACSSTPPDLVVAPPRGSSSAVASASALTPVDMPRKPALKYPENKPDAKIADTLFGVRVEDPYRWLEDIKRPDVVEWADAQDKLARAELGKLPGREALTKRLRELTYLDTLSAPRKRKDRYFYSRRHADKEKGIVYYRDGKGGAEKVLFDPNGWSKDGSVSLGAWSPSRDGKKVAYAVKRNNSDEATLKLIDVATMKDSAIDEIQGAKYAYPSWTPGGDGFYYTWLPVDPAIKPADRPGFAEIRFHKLGTDPKTDVVVMNKTGDASKFVGGELTYDGRFLFVSIDDGWTSNELSFRPGGDPKAKFVALSKPGTAHYRADAYKGSIYLMTDEGAPRWRIFKIDPKKPQRDAWQEIVKEDPTRAIDGFSLIGGKLVLSYLDKATSRLEIHGQGGKLERKIELSGLATVTGMVGEPDDNLAYYGFESFTAPQEIQELDVTTGKTAPYSKVSVPLDSSKLVTEQVTYKSKDGTPVTMFVVHAKGTKLDGSNPVMLYGYGGFQVNETPGFYPSFITWIEQGGVLAVPNLRGGAEYGEEWHQAGMKLKKQNVFDDFIHAAKFLIDAGWTRPEKLVVSGASNGGLLVGAVMTQAPELFAGVICGVPLLDMVRYHQFGSGRTWISEYGSAENEAEFKALYAYSPYHHVAIGKKYPALLMMGADSDDRVDPLHARKFTALIQDRSAGGPALLRIEKNSGHGGADMRKAEVERNTDRIAFALSITR